MAVREDPKVGTPGGAMLLPLVPGVLPWLGGMKAAEGTPFRPEVPSDCMRPGSR